MDNRTIALKLTEYAHMLESHRANLYRIRAYRTAAQAILGLDQPLEELVREKGRRGLTRLPGVGAHLAYTLEELVRTGEFRTLTDERGRPILRDRARAS